MNCYQAKAGELAKQWFVIDADDAVVGRLAAQIAPILMGKHRPTYTAHIDTGDYVIVTNVDKVVFTGNKWQQKFYQRYSGHPGGQKEEQAFKLFQRHPDRILRLAIQRMMPKNKIGRHMMSKLKLYSGSIHEHQAQDPIPLAAIEGRPSAAGAILMPKPVPKAKAPRAPRKSANAEATAAAPAAIEAHAEPAAIEAHAEPAATEIHPEPVATEVHPEPEATPVVPAPEPTEPPPAGTN